MLKECRWIPTMETREDMKKHRVEKDSEEAVFSVFPSFNAARCADCAYMD